MPTVLILAASRVAPIEQLTALPSLAEVQLNEATIVTGSGTLTPQDLAGAPRFDLAVSTGPSGHHSVALLGTISAALAPGGKLVVHETPSDAATLQKNLILSGFASPAPLPSGSGLSASKPAWETGAKAAITLKPKAAPKKTWTLAADDEDDELLGEDELLTEEDLARPAAPAANDDCEVGASGKKACDNCTCGRADGEERKLTKEMVENPTSGCGSCAMGDAFRCSGCPYRGLPAFEMGKRIELPADFLLADLE